MDHEKRMAWAKDEMVKNAVQCALERDAFLCRKDEQAAAISDAKRDAFTEAFATLCHATSEDHDDSEF